METFKKLPDQRAWRVLVGAAQKAAREKGFTLERMPGRGRSNVWRMTLGNNARLVSIRTSQNRWVAFPPLERGKKWKTLDDVDSVIVAAVDDGDDPKNVEIYLFDAAKVRDHFRAAYSARTAAGHAVRDNFGMWINLDRDQRGLPASAGSGLADIHEPVAVYPLDDLVPAFADEDKPGPEGAHIARDERSLTEPNSIGDVMSWARERIAALAGVRTEAVKLDLKIEY